jgi:hypothetical protein
MINKKENSMGFWILNRFGKLSKYSFESSTHCNYCRLSNNSTISQKRNPTIISISTPINLSFQNSDSDIVRLSIVFIISTLKCQGIDDAFALTSGYIKGTLLTIVVNMNYLMKQTIPYYICQASHPEFKTKKKTTPSNVPWFLFLL